MYDILTKINLYFVPLIIDLCEFFGYIHIKSISKKA